MQTQLSGTNTSSNILSKPEHILSFVKHALQSAVAPQSDLTPRNAENDFLVENLRITPADDQSSNEGDSDDEESCLIGESNNEITNTALNLLLSILEGALTLPALNLY
jgi:hypothetical protein